MFSDIMYTMRKYTGVEKTEVLSPEDHEKISSTLQRVGKTSVKEMTEEEKNSLNISLEDHSSN